jgi:hypothetical protein
MGPRLVVLQVQRLLAPPRPARYGYDAKACTTAYDYICEVPQTKYTCVDSPPAPPPIEPTCECLPRTGMV